MIVTETDTITGCTSTDTTITGITPASVTYSFTVPGAACNYVSTGPGGGSVTLTWNNGQSSTLTGTANILTSTGSITQQTITGTVTAGEFTGATAVFTWTYPTLTLLQCLTTGGVTSQNGTILYQITGL